METLHHNNQNNGDVYPNHASHSDVMNAAAASSDSSRPIQWVMIADWHNLAYEEISSLNDMCVVDLVNLLARVKAMSSLNSELADKYEAPKIFLEECVKFLALSKANVLQLSKNKCFMLMTLVKSFLVHFKFPMHTYQYGKYIFSLSHLSQIPELQQQMKIDVLPSNPSLPSESEIDVSGFLSQWVRLDDWHDQAYLELESIRCMYFSQLFRAYNRVCSLSSKNQESGIEYEAVKIFLLEYCKFLSLSRSDIVRLSKGECYVFLMLIKNELLQQLPPGCQSPVPMLQDELETRVRNPSLIYESALNYCAQLYQDEWITLAHQELESLRNKYSSLLDKANEKVSRLGCQFSEADNKHELVKAGIKRVLNLLSMSSAEISHLSKETFNDKIKKIDQIMKRSLFSQYLSEQLLLRDTQSVVVPDLRQPMNNEENSVLRREALTDSERLVQPERFTNLIDQKYEELQLVKKEHYPVMLAMSHTLSQGSQYERHFRKGFDNCFKFLEMTRCAFSLFPPDDYERWVKRVESLVALSKKEVARAPYSAIKQRSYGYREVA